MDELDIKVLANVWGDERVVILERSDGSFVYRRQWRSASRFFADQTVDEGAKAAVLDARR